jgi:hypothetical protein
MKKPASDGRFFFVRDFFSNREKAQGRGIAPNW